MVTKRVFAIFQAIMAAVCYGISIPLSKILLNKIEPLFLASLLYIGAGIGMLIVNFLRGKNISEAKITKKELPYTVAMVLLDIAAPIFLMVGLLTTTSSNASLINNFEIVTTTLIALIFFKEVVGRRMWIAIILITISTIILSVKDFSSLSFSVGSIFVLIACLCWGIENNCTRMLSLKDPLQIVIIKGLGSGFGALMVALIFSELSYNILYILLALLLGFVSYGLSIFFYIYAQRELGASRTSAYYAFAPFIGVGLSFLLLRESITPSFLVALLIMLIGTYLAAFEKHNHKHKHSYMEHDHRHNHSDEHHHHLHNINIDGEHTHMHIHENIEHTHNHTPDLHHTHDHKE